MASVWIPLNYPEPINVSQQSVHPDITISNIYELKSLLIVDDPTPPVSTNQGPTTSGSTKLKLKASRSTGTPCAPLSTTSSMVSSCIGAGCFSKSKVAVSSTAPYPKRFLPPPDLYNNNSNASDGS